MQNVPVVCGCFFKTDYQQLIELIEGVVKQIPSTLCVIWNQVTQWFGWPVTLQTVRSIGQWWSVVMQKATTVLHL
jgi:hypothetical protein